MMLLPMLNGGRVAKEWQPMSALMCSGPVSFCSSLSAAKNGRSGQPVHSPDGRAGTSAASFAAGSSGNLARARRGGRVRRRCPAREELPEPLAQHVDGVLAVHGQQVPCRAGA